MMPILSLKKNEISVCEETVFGGGLAQWLVSRTTDQAVPGSRSGRVAVRFVLEQVTFTPCLVLVKPRKPWTYDWLGQSVPRLETTLCLMC